MPWSNLGQRCREPEVMDQRGLDPLRHRAALRGLGTINSLSNSVGILWPALAKLAAEHESLRVLDVACGGGDVTIALWQRARQRGVAMHVDGCDISTTALEYAAERARDCGAQVGFNQCDILRDPIPGGYDVLVCSLFLHHLADDEAIALLRRSADAGFRLVLINDLRRNRAGLLLAHAAGLITGSDVVRIDGPRSVRAAFSIAEAAGLARAAGMTDFTVQRRWPCRFLLTWRSAQES